MSSEGGRGGQKRRLARRLAKLKRALFSISKNGGQLCHTAEEDVQDGNETYNAPCAVCIVEEQLC